MNIVSQKRKCTNCGKEYLFHPSVGDMGQICSVCGCPQGMKVNMPRRKKNVFERLKDLRKSPKKSDD